MPRHHAGSDRTPTPEAEAPPRVELLVAVCQAKCSESGPIAKLTERLEKHFEQQGGRDKDLHDKINTTTNRVHWMMGGLAAILALLGLVHLRLSIAPGSAPAAAAIVQVDKSSVKADNLPLIGTAQAAPADWVVAPAGADDSAKGPTP